MPQQFGSSLPLQNPTGQSHSSTEDKLSNNARSQHSSSSDHKDKYDDLDDAQLRALCKDNGYAQGGNRDALIQRLRTHDARAMGAEGKESRDSSRSSSQGAGWLNRIHGMVDLGVFVIVDMGIFIGGAVAFFVLAAQLLWMFLKDNLPYSTLITVIEWRPIVVWWIPLGLGVALGVGKSLLFKPRSGSFTLIRQFLYPSFSLINDLIRRLNAPQNRPAGSPNHLTSTNPLNSIRESFRRDPGETSLPDTTQPPHSLTTQTSSVEEPESLQDSNPTPPWPPLPPTSRNIPPTLDLSDSRLPMSIQLPRSPITPTGNDDMVENLPCDAQSNDTELSRDLEVLKHDCDWKSLRDRLYSDTVSSLPLLPPTPTGFTQTPRRLFVYRVLAANAAKERAIEERDEYYEAKACLAQRIVSMHDQLYNEARIGRDQIDQITDLRIRNQDLQDTTTSLSQEKETLGQEILASNGKEALIQDLTYRNKVLQDVNTSLARENATIHDRCSQETSISQSLSKRNKIQAQAASRYCRELFLTRNNIWVVVRIRNPIPSDEAKPVLGFSLDPVNMKLGILSNDDTTWLAEAESIHEQLGIVSVGSPIQPAQARTESGSFTFDSVLLPPTSNIQVCIEIEPTIQAFLDGHDMCIIADGQSGSGKSYTMLNGDHSIADWAARFTFEWMELAERPHRECAAKCSILEIYKNRTRDLLADNDPPGQKTIEIRRSGPDPISCESYHPLRSADDVSKLRRKACAQRVNRSTDQNQSSSRSDLILIITLTQFDVATKTSATSSLFLVDLAGSEVWPDSSPHDEEIKAIKQSRECLKQAMIKYQASTEPIPGNQLTLLLRRCFQPPSKIVLLATASPLQQDQKATQATLNFASHIRNSKTQPPKTKKTAKEKK